MPIYEYQCQACQHTLEAFQKMSESPLTECPACHGQALQRLISAAGFQLKGTGWYATDFRNTGKSQSSASPDPKTDSSAITKSPADNKNKTGTGE